MWQTGNLTVANTLFCCELTDSINMYSTPAHCTSAKVAQGARYYFSVRNHQKEMIVLNIYIYITFT
jgi:hypothetical protein